MKLRAPVYFFDHTPYGFGDRWSITNFLLRASEYSRRPALVAGHSWHPEMWGNVSQLHSPGRIHVLDWHGGNKFVPYCDTFKIPFCRTKTFWAPNTNKYVCYQLDGVFMAEVKNLTDGETHDLFRFVRSQGFELVNVGHHRPLIEVISLMSRARAFIGIPSGISHVACSVRVPAFIICKPTFGIPWHLDCIYKAKPNIKLCSNMGVFKEQFNAFLECPPGTFVNERYPTML